MKEEMIGKQQYCSCCMFDTFTNQWLFCVTFILSVAFMKDNEGRNLPTVKELLRFRCSTDWPLVKWIWTKLLPAAVGKTLWNKEKVYSITVSHIYTEMDEDGQKQKVFNIPIGLEAFMLVCWENNYEKYQEILKDQKKTPKEERSKNNIEWHLVT